MLSYIANETESCGHIALHNHKHHLGPSIDLLQNHVQLTQRVPPLEQQCLHQRGNACMKGELRTGYIIYDILYDITKLVNIIHDIIYVICDITNPRGKFYWKPVDNGMRSTILALNPPVLVWFHWA